MCLSLVAVVLLLLDAGHRVLPQQYPPGVPPQPVRDEIKFHEPHNFPQPSPPPQHPQHQGAYPQQQGVHQAGVGRGGQPGNKHVHIHVDMEQEREHMMQHIKEEYIDTANLDDNTLLMQYFRKHDTDHNMKLDGLELLKAITIMSDEDHDHEDEHEEAGSGDGGRKLKASVQTLPVEDMLGILDTILQQDDTNKDGYITWPEFLARQKMGK